MLEGCWTWASPCATMRRCVTPFPLGTYALHHIRGPAWQVLARSCGHFVLRNPWSASCNISVAASASAHLALRLGVLFSVNVQRSGAGEPKSLQLSSGLCPVDSVGHGPDNFISRASTLACASQVFLSGRLVGTMEHGKSPVLRIPACAPAAYAMQSGSPNPRSCHQHGSMELLVLVHAMGRNSAGCDWDFKGLVGSRVLFDSAQSHVCCSGRSSVLSAF